jgi:hypothetical protein
MAETAGRRTLTFRDLDDVLPDVERLLHGHQTLGHWSLGQICRHLATVLKRVVDLPASTPFDPSQALGEEAKRQVLESGTLPEGLPAPAEIVPTEAVTEAEGLEELRQAVAYYKASPGPVVAHRLFGKLTRAEWDRLQCIHCAHHLSFVIPH